MTITEIEPRLIRAIEDHLGISGVTLETSFRGDLELDSLDILDLIVALESEFEIEMPQRVPFRTAGDVLGYLCSQ